MRLSDILSKSPADKYVQVDSFLDNKKLSAGVQRKIDIGNIALNYYCHNCNDVRTFCSNSKLFCIGVSDTEISIDCYVECARCHTKVPMWFLVESNDKMYSGLPKVRISKMESRLPEEVSFDNSQYGDYTYLLNKAECAFNSGLGAGSIVYLRKIFELVANNSAKAVGITTKKKKGGSRPFKELLQEVDAKCHIIPPEFSQNGYSLFSELSNVVHGEYDENLGIKKYPALKRLIIGILDNIRDQDELKKAMERLGWETKCEVNV